MPPKKVEEPERKPLIGRVGTNLKVGIVGIPNVGKSTFFNVLTKSQAAAENFPFCTIDPNENNRKMCDSVLRERNHDKLSQDYPSEDGLHEVSDQKVLNIRGYACDDSASNSPSIFTKWCPRVGIYYAYTEDTNPFDRIEEFVAEERQNCDTSKIQIDRPLNSTQICDPYEENASQAEFLRSKPVCFAIFGKPGLDTSKLAKLVADWWKCVLISPESLIHDEIEKNTEKGRWINESLNNNKSLGPNVVMKLIESRIKKRDVLHRGYVVEGLPLIPDHPEVEYAICPGNNLTKCLLEKCNIENCARDSESSTISSNCSVKSSARSSETDGTSFVPAPLERRNVEIRTNILDPAVILGTLRDIEQTGAREDTNPFGDESSNGEMSEKYEDYIPEQIKMIFNSWPLSPTIIIYVACPDEDLMERGKSFRSDPFAGKKPERIQLDAEGSFEIERLPKNVIKPDIASTRMKFQCEIYRRCALPVIERQVLLHDPQKVIRIEGRTSISQMFEVVNAKLRSLPVSQAIIPKRIWDYPISRFEGENDEEFEYTNENIDDRINEDMFEELARKFTVSTQFPWTMSSWKFTCPVELAKGRTVEGKSQYAVRFMNKLFFLSSFESMEYFLENPRPFVLSMKPRPSCKIAILGPKYSGKSEVSAALGRNFHENVIDVSQLIKNAIDERMNEKIAVAVREARDRVIEDLRRILEAERETRENTRREALDYWFNEAKEIVQRLAELKMNFSDEPNSSEEDMKLRKSLRDCGLQIFENNTELLTDAVENINTILQYAPDDLRYEESPIRELSEHDPEIAAMLEREIKHLRNEKIAITDEEIGKLLISRIKMMPDERIDEELSREPGWIVDGMNSEPRIWTVLTEAGVIFDDLILITEESPYKNLLRNRERYYEADSKFREEDYGDEITEDLKESRDIENYIVGVKEFEENWEDFRAILDEAKQNYFVCKLNETPNVYEILSNRINDRYRPRAKIMTYEEGEFADTIETVTDVDEEELEDEELEESNSEKIDNRQLGDTGIYCPVVLARNNVLWKGKKEYSAVFLDKIYMCSSAEDLESFVENPQTFNVPFEKASVKIPPARICIVGSPGSGKTTIAKILAAEYCIKHVDFSRLLDNYANNPAEYWSDLPVEKYNNDEESIPALIQQYKKDGAILPKKILGECYLNFFTAPGDTSAIIFDSFPNCLEDAESSIDNYAIPDLVIQLESDLEKVQERLLPKLLEATVRKQESREFAEWQESSDEGEEDNSDEEFIEKAKYEMLQDIEEKFERANKMLDDIRSIFDQQSIPWIIVNSDKDVNTLLSNLRKIIEPLIQRKASPFERTYQVNPYKADDLLECGYYLLSSFGRSCPVQLYEKKNPFQMYLPMDERSEIFSIIYRRYIYFIAGEEAAKKFTKNPLKYIQQDFSDAIVPAKISIIGPPKCGKSTLAQRFARTYGLRVINREDALSWTRKNYNWTKNESEIEDLLMTGQTVGSKFIARAVELYLSDYQSSTQGYILDGFPKDRAEMEEFALLNIRPMIVLNLKADKEFCLAALRNDRKDNETLTDKVIKSMSVNCEKWLKDSPVYVEWIRKYTQNVVDIDATQSKWAVWRQANHEICSKFAEIKRYFSEVNIDKVHRLKSLCVTPYEFKNRQSSFESYCPVCTINEDKMTFSGSPPDRRGVVQFREYFYWICPKHFAGFTQSPLDFFRPKCSKALPAERPRVLNDEIDIEHACWAKRLVNNGNCVVTYAEALPEYVIVPGKRNIGALYQDNLYLFCTSDCREKFLTQAAMYAKIIIEISEATSAIALKNLKNLDYLEKTVAKEIIKSVTEVASKRPKYPGLSPAASAAVHIGIHLKLRNVNCVLNEIEAYEEVLRRVKALRRVPVPDARFDYLCEYFKPASKVPAFLNVVDIAGLVKGAAEGQGLGNAFLSHISACDAIFHLCRAFEDDDVTHIEGDVNPVRDLEIISEELRLKDVEFLGVHLEKLEKLVVRGNDKKLKPEYETLLKVKNILHEEKKHIRFADWSVNEIEILNKYLFLTSKPVIYLVNLSEKDYIRKKNKWLIKIKEWVDKNDPGASLIPFSGAFENKVIDMEPAEAAKYFEESKVTSALDKIIVQGYKALQLQYFFTSGADEVKAWTIQKGTKAPQAAGRIHTDFEKGFIMAEVMKFDDFKNEGSEFAVKSAGKYRQQGRNYVVDDGDIIFFKFNAGAGLKDAKKK